MLFEDVWEEARRAPFDDACCRLTGLYELAKHHPSLQPEMKRLGQLDRIHSGLCRSSFNATAGEDAAVRFWERSRTMDFDEACLKLGDFLSVAGHHPALQSEIALIKELVEIHAYLCINPISARLRQL